MKNLCETCGLVDDDDCYDYREDDVNWRAVKCKSCRDDVIVEPSPARVLQWLDVQLNNPPKKPQGWENHAPYRMGEYYFRMIDAVEWLREEI